MPQLHDFKRRVQEDPTQVGKYFRLGDLSWFNKPEGEGCIEKFCSINYHLAKTIIPATAIYQICVKSIRSPLGWLFMTGKVVAPFHVAASIFAVSACGLCKYRGKDLEELGRRRRADGRSSRINSSIVDDKEEFLSKQNSTMVLHHPDWNELFCRLSRALRRVLSTIT